MIGLPEPESDEGSHRTGAGVMLTAPDTRDCAWLGPCLTSWLASERWAKVRYRTPAPTELEGLLLYDVAFQRVIYGSRGGPVGLVQISSYSLSGGHASLDFMIRPSALGGLASEGFRRFLDEACQTLPLRKAIVALSDDTIDLSSLSGRQVTRAGVLRAHRYDWDGRFADIHLYEIWTGSREMA